MAAPTPRADPATQPLADPGVAASILGPGYRRLTAGVVVSVLLVAFEAMAVATAMPVAVRELCGLASYAWGFSSYLITSLLAIVVAGSWCDARGPYRPLLAGLTTFGVGLVISGTAVDMGVFIAGRAVQGLGGGLVIVALYVVVGRAYPPSMQPRMFAAMSSGWVLPSIIGPALAGWSADHWTWRAVFLALVPAVAVVLVVVLSAASRLPGLPGPRRPVGRLRWACGAAAGAGLLQYGAAQGGGSGAIAALLGLALLVPSVPRLLPAGTLRARRGLPTTILLRGVVAGSFGATETFLPLMLVRQRGLSTTAAGLTLTGAALSWAWGSWFQGRPRTTIPRPRLIRLGASLLAVGVAAAAAAAFSGVPVLIAAVGWVLAGLGMGFALTSLSVLTLTQSPIAEQGANSAALQVSDALGVVLLTGLAGAAYGALRTSGDGSLVYLVIDAVMVAVAVTGAVLALRVAPTSERPDG